MFALNCGDTTAAFDIAKLRMSECEVDILLLSQAQRMEAAGKLKEPELLYLEVNQFEMAIGMYKKHNKWEAAQLLVSIYCSEKAHELHRAAAQYFEALGDFQKAAAQNFEALGDLKKANMHLPQAGDWVVVTTS